MFMMNLFARKNIFSKITSVFVIFAMFLQFSTPLLSVALADSVSTPTNITLTSDSLDVSGGETKSVSADTTGYENLKLSFDYDFTKLEGGESLSYGWSLDGGTTVNNLGSIEGVSSDENATGSVTDMDIPSSANGIANLVFSFENDGAQSGVNNQVSISNITLTGTEISASTSATFVLSVPDATITKSTLVDVSSGDQTTINTNVNTAISGVSSIAVSLQNTGTAASENVRIAPVNGGGHIQLWAKDTTGGNWFDINKVGWMPAEGISFTAGYNGTTSIYVFSDESTSYPLTINLIKVSDNSVVATDGATLTVEDESTGGPIENNPAIDNGYFAIDNSGFNVGFDVHDFVDVNNVTVELQKTDGTVLVSNTGKSDLFTLIDGKTDQSISTPFSIPTSATSDNYWTYGNRSSWTSADEPNKAVVTITQDDNTSKTITLSPYTVNESTPDATFTKLLENTPSIPTISACPVENTIKSTDLTNWYMGDTGTAGHNEIVANGLHVWTDSNTSTDKAAGYYYFSANGKSNLPLKDVCVPSIDQTNNTDGRLPSIQLTVDNNGNGQWYGNLVYEPTAGYGEGNWWSSKNFNIASGGGYTSMGTLQDYLDANPNMQILAIGYSLGSGVKGDTTINKITVGDTQYTFDLAPIDTSNFVFVGSPRYVRANNAGDESARILVSNTATDAQFFVDGSTAIAGELVGASTATTEWWKLKTSLLAGEHTIAAQVKINGVWQDIPGSAIAYSIDSPWAEYIIPQANQYFRPNDKVVRVKADDEFDQFNYMKTVINGTVTTVNRADCTDEGSYVLCDLQNLNLPDGTYTATTTTYTKANNRADKLVSPSFTIDNTRPTLSNFVITNSNSSNIYGEEIDVKADASDDSGIKNITFYITAPRSNDGVCDGNGTKLFTTTDLTSPYEASFDTSSLNGGYCLNAVAEDLASNHSLPIETIKVSIDNTVPSIPTLISPVNRGYSKTNDFYFDWSDSTDNNAGINYEFQSSQNPHTTNGILDVGVWNNIANGNSGQKNLTESKIHSVGAPDGDWYWQVRAIDAAGNKSAWTPVWKMTLDTHAPVTDINVSPVVDGKFTVSGHAGDNLALNRVYVQLSSQSQNLRCGGTTINLITTPFSTSKDWSVDYDIANLNQTGSSVKCAEGNYAAHAAVTDMAGNSSTAGWTNSFLVKNKPTLTGDYFRFKSTPTNNLNIGFHTTDLVDAKKVTITIYDKDGNEIIANTGDSTQMLDLLNSNPVDGISSPFYMPSATTSDGYWNFGNITWSNTVKPSYAVVSIDYGIGQHLTSDQIPFINNDDQTHVTYHQAIATMDNGETNPGGQTIGGRLSFAIGSIPSSNQNLGAGQVLGASTYNFTQFMKLGSKGNEVTELQKYLNENGFGPISVDGVFGSQTENAVKKFQTANPPLKVDGIVGIMTRAQLNK